MSALRPDYLRTHVPAQQDIPEESESDRVLLLKEAFQLLWALAMHSPLPLRDMTQGAGMFNTLVRAKRLRSTCFYKFSRAYKIFRAARVSPCINRCR